MGLQLGALLCVHYCCDWNAEVGGWAPEICRKGNCQLDGLDVAKAALRSKAGQELGL